MLTHWLPGSGTSSSTSSSSSSGSGSGHGGAAAEMAAAAAEIDCLCFGTGRFLRSVLVPAMVASGYHPALVQPRGRSFLEFIMAQEEDGCYYPVDTVLPSGRVQTDRVPCYGAFSLGRDQDKQAFYHFLPIIMKKSMPRIVGIGVTEAGLASANTQAMQDFYEFLAECARLVDEEDVNEEKNMMCVVNMDNVPNNGSLLQQHMETLAKASPEMLDFLARHVSFHDSMVDRITSQRSGSSGMIPSCEPLPAKALVVLDQHDRLPHAFTTLTREYGVVIRSSPEELQMDLSLKLRVANGTHTAVAHLLALLGQTQTERALAVAVNENSTVPPITSLLLAYLDALFESQILPAATIGLPSSSSSENDDFVSAASCSLIQSETQAVYSDWKRRLVHPHFGLSTFFITQNGAAKGGIRLAPTIVDLITMNDNINAKEQQQPVSVAMAFAFAVLLRWLTPKSSSSVEKNDVKQSGNAVFRGWLQPTKDPQFAAAAALNDNGTVEYADKLQYNLQEGWYQFRCACEVNMEDGDDNNSNAKKRNLSEWLGSIYNNEEKEHQPSAAYYNVIRAYLIAPDGGNMSAIQNRPELETFTRAVATLYCRMVAGDDLLTLLQEMNDKQGPYSSMGLATDCSVLVDDPSSLDVASGRRPLHYRPPPIPDDSALMTKPVSERTIASVVASEVASVIAIDLHTHLLPPSHGSLCLWGIDELLTYHYLVAEYFMTAPASMTPEAFYAKTKKKQADIIWKALFIDRSPISEACRGVVTTLVALGLAKEVATRDLDAVRAFYKAYRDQGFAGAEKFSNLVLSVAGVRYIIMTNIPFDPNEAQHWRPNRKELPAHYRSALRVDPLLTGDRGTVERALMASGFEPTLEGARQYLRDWCDTMTPAYMMASTPHDFVLKDGTLDNVIKTGLNEEAMKQPGAFADVIASDIAATCSGTEDDAPSVIDENSDFLSEVLMRVCEERDLPIALKIGAHRGVNPRLKAAGDGMVAFADASMLGRLCSRYPKVRFLATFLSRNNQHEACVLASKFRNLHIYGCWWFCNNPSIIKEITAMRIEMLGTSFTVQHSDARILDQLIYKWSHARSVVSSVVQGEYSKLIYSGWKPTRREIRRDISRLFGGSYEEFMQKSLA